MKFFSTHVFCQAFVIFSLSNSIGENFKSDGIVSIIDPLVDDETRTFKIIGIINNKDYKLKPGLMVNLKLFRNKTNFNPRSLLYKFF